jgi:hypothetical protein
LREIKYVGTKDRLNANQHRLADLLFELFPDRIDLQVLEWADLPRRSIVGQAAERAAFEPNRAPT